MQLAVLFSLLANQGEARQPYLVESLRSPETGQIVWEHSQQVMERWEVEGVGQNVWALIEEGLRQVVDAGTGRGAKIPGYKIFGKTGTAQNPHGEDHALFACYLKDQQGKTRLAMSVVIDNGGQGSVAAVPVAKKNPRRVYPHHAGFGAGIKYELPLATCHLPIKK